MSFTALDIASSGLQTQSTAIGVISNNIANLQTTGFKGYLRASSSGSPTRISAEEPALAPDRPVRD